MAQISNWRGVRATNANVARASAQRRVRLERARVTQTDRELVDAAIAQGRVTHVPRGRSGLPPVTPMRKGHVPTVF